MANSSEIEELRDRLDMIEIGASRGGDSGATFLYFFGISLADDFIVDQKRQHSLLYWTWPHKLDIRYLLCGNTLGRRFLPFLGLRPLDFHFRLRQRWSSQHLSEQSVELDFVHYDVLVHNFSVYCWLPLEK